MEAPFARAHARDVRRVELAGGGAALVVEQERQPVDEILLLRVDDLELGQEQVRRRQRQRLEPEAVAKVEGVAHLEMVEQDIDRGLAGVGAEHQAAMAVDGVEAPLGDEAELLEDAGDAVALRCETHEIQIAVGPGKRRGQGRRAAQPDGHAAEHPERHARLRGRSHDAARVGEDVGIGRHATPAGSRDTRAPDRSRGPAGRAG